MDQRMIVAYLALKGMSARAIDQDLVVTLGCNAVVYSSVMRNLREVRCLRSHEDISSVEIKRAIDNID
jgi:hypothetical protein